MTSLCIVAAIVGAILLMSIFFAINGKRMLRDMREGIDGFS